MGDRFASLSPETELPAADLLVVATSDDHIESTARRLAPNAVDIAGVIHLSGFKSIDVLAPFVARGIDTGSFHPLQSLPDPQTGANSLRGSWAGLTASGSLLGVLEDLATSLGMASFALPDSVKPIYHAAASAASNYVVAALDLADSLFDLAALPFEALAPLTRNAVANAFARGPGPALTGPIARGDWDTVRGQFEAVALAGADRERQFRLMAEATAITARQTFPADPLSDDVATETGR